MSWTRRRVLVTRPEPGASATAARLAQEGFDAVKLPLSGVAGLETRVGEGEDFDAVAATSANALRFAGSRTLAVLAGKPLFAVGAATAAAAREAGFADVREGSGDAASLARLLLARSPSLRVLYLCGRIRRPDFEDVLRRGGAAVRAAETYDTLAREPGAADMEGLGPAGIDAVLLTSVLGAQVFARLLQRRAAAEILANAEAFALSARIAAALPPGLALRIAAKPDEASLLAALREWAAG